MNDKNKILTNQAGSGESDAQREKQYVHQEEVSQHVGSDYSEFDTDTLSTLDALSRRKRHQQYANYGFYPQLAVNAYLSNQVRGKSIDKTQSLEIDSLIDVCL